MEYREALPDDIEGMHKVRMSVKENILNTPSLVSHDDYVNYLTANGKGWLAEEGVIITGFAIIDTERNNIWALFVDPAFEQMGIGRRLHDIMLNWHFAKSAESLWLTTAPGTRAEIFYRLSGWQNTGLASNGEVKFIMSAPDWRKQSKFPGS